MKEIITYALTTLTLFTQLFTVNPAISKDDVILTETVEQAQPIAQKEIEATINTVQTTSEPIENTISIGEPTQPKINNLGTKEIKVYNSNYIIPEDLSNNLYNVIKSYPGLNIGIYAISLKDYSCIGYNESFSFETASTVKAPFALYVMKEIANGNHTLNEKVTYTQKFYNSGSGTIKGFSYGTEFTVQELITYMINCSDNIAYLMLQDHFGYEGYNNMVSELGCTIWLNGYTKWGLFKAEELAIIWNEIYNFSRETKEGEFLLNLLIDAKYNFIKESLGRYSKIAHKSGFTSTAYNDAAIIFTKSDLNPELGAANDYILVVMATPGNTGYNKTALGKISQEVDSIMRDLAKHQ